ncbi:two-component regulator propeller domain-containing protein [uncultured Maribacter sp.]|uniref:two-component regulator propeller domain-containing protein n=1 Tax=uncultured Maribacter sp. TaxID=431308 RepID=UPI0026237CFB|nr:two-component regulator propeller domain-containing protein [uncultured Maribacter sp.]
MKSNIYCIIRTLILAFVSLSSQCIWAQEAVKFEHLTTKNGLSQNDINDIYQDNKGFLWFATHDGLNKYDGYEFTIYQPNTNDPESISSNLIYSIVGDNEDNLWIGTTGSGLEYFNQSKKTFTHYTHNDDDNSSLVSDYIHTLFIDSKNRLWIGSPKGLDMVNLENGDETLKFNHFSVEQNVTAYSKANNINSIYEDSAGTIWVGTLQGLYTMSRNKDGEYYMNLVSNGFGLPRTTIGSIGEDKYGRLLIGSYNGLYISTDDTKSKVELLYPGFYNDVLVDNTNDIWLGTNNGLLCFENKNESSLPTINGHYKYDSKNAYSLSKNIVQSLFIDETGILWVGTNGGGVNKYDRKRKQFQHFRKNENPNSLSYDKIRSIYEDSNGTLWIGTEGGGLNMLKKHDDDGQYSKFKVFNNIKKPFALTESIKGGKKTLFIGSEGYPALYKLDITNPKNVKKEMVVQVLGINRGVFSLLTDSQQNIWIGTYGAGVHRWSNSNDSTDYQKDLFKSKKYDSTSISNDIVRSIYEDRKGNVWFGTGNGLSKLTTEEKNKKKPKFTVYKNKPDSINTISHNYILAIYESTLGDIWIGTFGGGLNKLVYSENGKTEKFISYTQEDGLPNNVIKGILEDDEGNLWLSTNKGLSKFNPKERTFKNYDVNDGLQSNEFQELAALKRKDGELLFGGVNGFNAFYPKKIEENKIKAETVITKFFISNKPVEIDEEVNGRVIINKSIAETKKIELKYIENSFSFEFAALHFAAPDKNKFAYKLENFDSEWIVTTSDKRFATYTNLEPGDYVLKVKASNNDGLWDATPSEIRIKVIPPWWRTNLAYVIYGIMVMGVLWLFWRYTFIKTTKKLQLEYEFLEKQKSDELHKIKLDFFTNISHEFRTPLSLIKGPLEYLDKNFSELEPEKAKKQFHVIRKNSDYLHRLVNQLLDFRKINQGKMPLVVRNSYVVEFIKELAEPFQFQAFKRDIDFSIDAENEELVSWFDHEAMEKIINNLLSNAFKFTENRGFVTINISEKKYNSTSYVVIKVKDSGIGIEKVRLEEIFERFHTEKDYGKINPEGIGIGLTFTKKLVQLHRGFIKVSSEINKGSEFEVRLPKDKEIYKHSKEITCKEVSDNDFLVRSSEAESFAIDLNDEITDSTLTENTPKQASLLIVDDNSEIRGFIKDVLEDYYTIYEAENGEKGLEIVNQILPNIVISDVLMPVMDGIEFCKNIKSNKETSHIPVIILTAKTSQENELESLQIGADDYIRKPFDIELLQLKINNIIKRREKLRERFNKEIILQPKDVAVTSLDEKFLQQAMDIIEKHMMNTEFNVEMLVKEMGHSRTNLYMKFKELTGLSSGEFIRNIRLKRAVQLLENSDLPVKDIMYKTGFNTSSYFSKCFRKQFGVTPSQYVRKKPVGNLED